MCTIAQKSFVILVKHLKIETWDISVVLNDRKDLNFRLFLFDSVASTANFCNEFSRKTEVSLIARNNLLDPKLILQIGEAKVFSHEVTSLGHIFQIF